MLKRCFWLTVVAVFCAFQLWVGSASAAELDESIRTIKSDPAGNTEVISIEEFEKGKRLFLDSCATCHAGGITKTNFNIDLSPESLSLATPPRNNLAAMLDYIKNPTTYDGLMSIAEFHPATSSADIFPKMRNLSEDDLVAIAGYILVEPQIPGNRWGKGKSSYSA